MSTDSQPHIPRRQLDYLKRQILDSPYPAALRHPSQARNLYWHGHDIFVVPEMVRPIGHRDPDFCITFETPYAEVTSWLLASLCEQFAPQRQKHASHQVVTASLLALLVALDTYDQRSPRKLLASMLYEIYKLCGFIDVELVEFLGRYEDADFRGSIEDELRSFDPEAP